LAESQEKMTQYSMIVETLTKEQTFNENLIGLPPKTTPTFKGAFEKVELSPRRWSTFNEKN
jgi:hypothetical protein